MVSERRAFLRPMEFRSTLLSREYNLAMFFWGIFSTRQLMWKVLEHWRRLHAIIQFEKETESRRERWRSKIHELIPDYAPNL